MAAGKNTGRKTSTGRTANRRKSTASSRTGSRASQTKSSSRKSTGTKRKANTRTAAGAKAGKDNRLSLLVFSCVLLVIFLCMTGVIRGTVGPAVKGFLSGLFGINAFLIPLFILAFIGYTVLIAEGNVHPYSKAGLTCFVILLGILTAFLSGTDMEGLKAMETGRFKSLYDAKSGPGALFGIAGLVFYNIFGTVGSCILLIIFMLAAAAFTAGDAFFDILSVLKERLFLDMPDDVDYYEEEHESERERRERIRKEREERRRIEEEKRQIREERRLKNEEERQLREEEQLRLKEEERERKREEIERRREEEKRLKEQASDMAILKNSINKAAAERNDSERLIKARAAGPLDDIHEITVIADPGNLASSRPEALRENISSRGIEGLKELKPGKDQDPVVKPLDVFEEKKEEVKEEVKEELKEELKEEAVKPVISHFESGKTEEIKQDEVLILKGLNEMPQPVTERNVSEKKDDDIEKKEIAKSAVKEEPAKESAPEKKPVTAHVSYERPSMSLLNINEKKSGGDSDESLKETALLLKETLKTFSVNAEVIHISQGPSVTRFELQTEAGTKVSKINSLTDDLKLALAAQDVRIEAPIPGKAAIGIEIPNKEKIPVLLRDLFDSDEFSSSRAPLTYAVGKDISGRTIISDIEKMPHLLIAGSTGSGKSVFINSIIMSLLYKSTPDEVKLILVDPKMVELTVYNGIPNLMLPVVSDPRQASQALNWAVAEMMRRYKAFSENSVRDIKSFNEKAKEKGPQKMPRIVIIVDELADLMMVAKKEVEGSICRLAQLARAAGIHLVIATQRPSVDVITGLIKANMPSRVALSVSSGTDSRTILDSVGAETLLGHGDMLFAPQNYTKPLRVQGAFVDDNEIMKVVEFLKKNNPGKEYDEELTKKILSGGAEGGDDKTGNDSQGASDMDEYFADACRFVVEKQKASSSMLQRVFKIGYNRAAGIVDKMEELGVVGAAEGSGPRHVLMNQAEIEQFLSELDA